MSRIVGINSTLKLYKFIPFKYVKRILQSGVMPIKRIDRWEDSYENYFLKNKFVAGKSQYDLKKISRKFYGLCFSSLDESDAMWRIYSDISGVSSDKKDGLDSVAIRVCVSPRQLYQLVPERDSISGGSVIKRVRYISQEDLEDELQKSNPYNINSLTNRIQESFFTKRIEFSHEKEVRYVFITRRYHRSSSIEMTLNPKTFFDEFTVDPRLSKSQYCVIKRELEALGVSAKKINQSTLYKYKAKTFTIVP